MPCRLPYVMEPFFPLNGLIAQGRLSVLFQGFLELVRSLSSALWNPRQPLSVHVPAPQRPQGARDAFTEATLKSCHFSLNGKGQSVWGGSGWSEPSASRGLWCGGAAASPRSVLAASGMDPTGVKQAAGEALTKLVYSFCLRIKAGTCQAVSPC